MAAMGGTSAGIARALGLAGALAALIAALALAPGPATGIARAKAPKCLGKTAKIVGSSRAETLRGTPGRDVIYAGGGKDKVLGRGGNDRICGASGSDTCDSGSAEAQFKGCEKFPLRIEGSVTTEAGGPVAGQAVTVSAGEAEREVITGPEGAFTAGLNAKDMPVNVLAEIAYDPGGGLPTVETANQVTAQGNEVDLGASAMPDTAGSEVNLVGAAGVAPDGSVIVTDVPPEVDRLFARAYDPDADAELFPGAFEQEGGIPLNSAAFMWMSALDSSGEEIHALSEPIEARVKVSPSQWEDLEDIEMGNDTIDFPFYTYDEDLDTWVQEGTNNLEDSGGQAIPPETEPELAAGTFPGDVYAHFTQTHLSWSNLDYAYNGPWTMTRMSDAERQSDCMQRAIRVAEAAIRSARGQPAFEPMTDPNDPSSGALAPGAGPEIRFQRYIPPGESGSYGHFQADEIGGRDDQIQLDPDFNAAACAAASPEGKRNGTLMLAAVILHESSHWMHHVRGGHLAGNDEPEGEAGHFVVRRLFGGIIAPAMPGNVYGEEMVISGEPLRDLSRDRYLDPDFWREVEPLELPRKRAHRGAAGSPLEVSATLPKSSYALGEQITTTVTYRNVSGREIEVLEGGGLEGQPLWFDLGRQGSRSGYLGRRVFQTVDWDADFTTLEPGGELQQTVDLIRAPDGDPLYDVSGTGSYELQAHYSPAWGIRGTDSNTVNFTVTGGGGLGGTITDGATGLTLPGARVRVIDGTATRFTQNSSGAGAYSVPELPPGDYTVKAWAPGYRESSQAVQVNAGATADSDLALDPFILSGTARFVVDWSGAANFLPKLWLPIEGPVAQRGFVSSAFKGRLDQCPFAHYDRESNTTERGPVILSVSEFLDGTYTLYTSRSIGGAMSAGAQVQIYDETGLVETVFEPVGVGAWWDLLRIDGATRQVTEVNTLSGTEPQPYATSFENCTTN